MRPATQPADPRRRRSRPPRRRPEENSWHARAQARGRTLLVFFAGVAAAVRPRRLGGTWKPALGLDLEGGTRITLTAEGNPCQSNLKEAASIIDQRVNGSGVAEAR